MEMYKKTFSITRLWIILTAGMVIMFGILLFVFRMLSGDSEYQEAQLVDYVEGIGCR